MSRLDYHPAHSPDEAVELLCAFGDEAQLLAGGTSIMVLQRLGLLGVEKLVGVRGIAELDGVTVTDAGDLRIGSVTTLRAVEQAAEVRRAVPALAAALHKVATIRIRNQATIGGSLAHADPRQDAAPMLMALSSHVETIGPDGARVVPVDALFTGSLTTTLAPQEMITHIVVSRPPDGLRAGYWKFLPGTQDDYATVSVAAAVDVADGRCARVRIALGSVAPTPVRAHHVERALSGAGADSTAIAEAAQLVRSDIDPISDGSGSAAYKRDVAVVCLRRLLTRVLLREGAQ